MVDSININPKRKKYTIWEPSGQKKKLLICFMSGIGDIRKCIKIIGNTESGYAYYYAKTLKNLKYLDEQNKDISAVPEKINKKEVVELNVNFFLSYFEENYNIRFSEEEIIWLKNQLERYRFNIIDDSLIFTDGNIISSFIYFISEELLHKKLLIKDEFYINISLKFLEIIMNDKTSIRLHSLISKFNTCFDNYFKRNKTAEDNKIKFNKIISPFLNVQKCIDEEFYNRIKKSITLNKNKYFEDLKTKKYL